MKKIFIILLSITLLTSCSKSNDEKLKDIGYKESDIKYIENLKTKSIDYILSNDYIDSLIDLIKNKDFNEDNLEKYIEYINKYSLSSDDAILIINNQYITDIYSNEILALMREKYFIYNNLDRYLSYIDENEDKEASDIIKEVNSNIDKDFYTDVKDADTSKGYLILVNKYNKLSKDYVPDNLVTIDLKYGRTLQIEKKTYEQFIKMYDDAYSEGLNLYIRSPYRSFATQEALYNNYVLNNGKETADTYSARAGYSEHQTGLAMDITTSSTNLGLFKDTKESEWLKENAYKYGFILRYPSGKEYITGYMYEPWHYRYVGIEAAKVIYENDLTFEEYYAYYVK